MSLIRFSIFIALMTIGLWPGTLRAQIVTGDGPRYPGTTGDPAPVDTSSLREGRTRTEETPGLFEGPIDPDQYRVGPGDLMTVSIVGMRSQQHDLEVSPDGNLLVPTVGKVDVRGKTLTQVERAVIAAAARVYASANVGVSLKRIRKFKVHVTGAVLSPGTVVAGPTTRVSEAIALAGGASSQADNRQIVLVHRDGTSSPVDLLPFFSIGARAANPELNDGDVVRVPFQDDKAIVQVFGAVQRPGEYTFHDGDSVSSMVRYVLGLTADADNDSLELVSVDDNGMIVDRTFHRLNSDGSVTDDRLLHNGDRIYVRAVPDYRRVDRVVVRGEVRYPGSYPVEQGKTRLRDLIERAGGFEADASIDDVALFRRRFASGFDPRFETINMIEPEKRTEEQMEYWWQKSREYRRPGEMTVDFAKLMRGDESQNLVLMDDDSLFVPEMKGVIRVTGKVRNPGAVGFKQGLRYSDYIGLAGGFGWRADDGATEIVKEGSGEVFLASSDDDYVLEPGDAIFVPEEKPGEFWGGLTTALTILAQVATIIAVVLSIRGSSTN